MTCALEVVFQHLHIYDIIVMSLFLMVLFKNDFSMFLILSDTHTIIITFSYFVIHHVTTKACLGIMIEIGANVMIWMDNGVNWLCVHVYHEFLKDDCIYFFFNLATSMHSITICIRFLKYIM